MVLLHDCPEDGAALSKVSNSTSISLSSSKVFLWLSNFTPACEGFYIHCLLYKQIVYNLNTPFNPIRDRKKGFDKDVVATRHGEIFCDVTEIKPQIKPVEK